MTRRRIMAAALAGIAVAALLTELPGLAPRAQAAPPPTGQPVPDTVDPAQRDGVLAPGWRQSNDTAWTVSADADGLHVLSADERSGYTWRTAATLSEPGVEADEWIGNGCLTGSGRRLVVAYAPRSFTNDPVLFDRAAYTAIVDIVDGTVRKLPVRTSLAYFDPGCGAGETAVLTQGGDDLGRTRLIPLDAAGGTLGKPIEATGELTSAVPTSSGIVAAGGAGLFRIGEDGSKTLLAESTGMPFRLHPDAAGGIVFMDAAAQGQARARRVDANGAVATVATGRLGEFRVTPAAAGKVYVTGKAETTGALAKLDTAAAVTLSSQARLAVAPAGPEHAGTPSGIAIHAKVVPTGKAVDFAVDPAARPGPHSADGRSPAVAGDPTEDGGYTCAIARNDPAVMAYQPTTRQAEWAVDMLVTGHPALLSRPANWQNSGLPAYQPLVSTAVPPLSGGGGIPATILLGILSQESNLWQASKQTPAGLTGNPLIGNFYGIPAADSQHPDKWAPHFADSDCGYGIAQVTDGMRGADTTRTRLQQKEIALDYAANIAAGAAILADKWNQLHDAGILLGDGSSAPIEHWYLAVWAYNTGLHTPAEAGDNNGAWGLGWLNNPANPRYEPDREPFLQDPHDAAHPQDWPYQEKVMGFAARGIDTTTGPTFKTSWWLTDLDRDASQPNNFEFCAPAANECDKDQRVTPTDPSVRGEPDGPCLHQSKAGLYDLKCFWHSTSIWRKDCPAHCGHGDTRYDPDPVKFPNPPDGDGNPPNCDTGSLPGGTLYVQSVPNWYTSPNAHCRQQPPDNGDFSFSFGSAAARIDLHQDGGGFGGHYWYGHTWTGSLAAKLAITGTWTLDRPLSQWARVLVHLPDHQAETQQASYRINLGDGTATTRIVPQGREANNWISLGAVRFAGTPSVTLANSSVDGTGDDAVAWNSIAFQPLSAKPKDMIVALGDSFTSGEGASAAGGADYYRESDNNHGRVSWDACRRSRNAWIRKTFVPGRADATIGTRADSHDPTLDLAFLACSGAHTYNVSDQYLDPPSWSDAEHDYWNNDGQFHEIAQLKSGFVNQDTTLVALTIGGNDENAFVNAVQDCVLIIGTCAEDNNYVPKYTAVINRTASKVKDLLTRVHTLAPHAQIMLLGYPELVSTAVDCPAAGLESLAAAVKLAKLATVVQTAYSSVVFDLSANDPDFKVKFVDLVTPFTAQMMCDPTPAINLPSVTPQGPGDFYTTDPHIPACFVYVNEHHALICLSRQSYHPNTWGTDIYARTLSTSLGGVGYHD
jgi:hypothetical protein